jgi:pimeloyl-ACP methyl ester carboxylesterase
MTESLIGPTSHYFYSQRLKLHYVDWGNQDRRPLLLIHGGRDHARNWDWVAQELRRDHHVVAPDLRGHGDSQWAIGGSYALVDYTLDVAQLLDALRLFPITIIGHSLGGSIALQYAGTYPERVKKVVAIEGLGPPPELLRDRPAHERMRIWISEMQALSKRHPHRYPSLDDAVARMRDANPRLTAEQASHLTVHGSYRDEDGTYLWKFDNYVRATSPYLFNMKDAREIWTQITCPVLLLRGTESWATDPEIDGRAGAFRDYRAVDIEGAGHWVHHDQLAAFLGHVREFLSAGAD